MTCLSALLINYCGVKFVLTLYVCGRWRRNYETTYVQDVIKMRPRKRLMCSPLYQAGWTKQTRFCPDFKNWSKYSEFTPFHSSTRLSIALSPLKITKNQLIQLGCALVTRCFLASRRKFSILFFHYIAPLFWVLKKYSKCEGAKCIQGHTLQIC